jgi:exopolysaccharide biosynthesis polyprenyl glycosylphosphotransferase
MQRELNVTTRLFYQLADSIGATALFIALLVIRNIGHMPQGFKSFMLVRITIGNVLLGAIFVILYHWAFELAAVYNARRFRDEVRTVAVGATGASLLVAVFSALSRGHSFTWSLVAIYWLVSVSLAITLRAGVRFSRHHLRHVRPREVLIVGSDERALELSRELQFRRRSGMRLVGFVDSPNGHQVPAEVERQMVGTLEKLDEVLMRTVVDQVIIALPIRSQYDAVQRAIAVCEQAGVEAQCLVPDLFCASIARPRIASLEDQSIVRLRVVHDDYRLVLKRALDLIGSTLALVILSPILITAAIAIKLSSPGPIFFVQERFGCNKRRFRMCKFRTMVPNADALLSTLEAQNEKDGPIFKMKRDPRVTPIGRILRSTSIDELPQLFNILRGEMSLVGPRPMSVRDVSLFSESWLMRRFSVKPGLTGLWQVSGRSGTTFHRWMSLDLEYIDRWSLYLDFKILAQTIPAVLKQDGAV